MGGLGLRKAAVHSAAAYYSSLHCSIPTLEDILGYLPDLSPLLNSCCPLLTLHSARSDWSSHQDIHTLLFLSGRCLQLLTKLPFHLYYLRLQIPVPEH